MELLGLTGGDLESIYGYIPGIRVQNVSPPKTKITFRVRFLLTISLCSTKLLESAIAVAVELVKEWRGKR